jgi:2-polyprenyl-3-methyl-5-hydroxy-6-metoxy-1,4-benzoquinol methylase
MGEAARLYDQYVAFKGWDDAAGAHAPEDFAALLRLSGKTGLYRLLDIGFGRGELLDWAKAQGIETHGVEIIPELVERACQRGHAAVQGGLAQLPDGQFDVVVATDVLEHLSVEQLQAMLADVRRLLKPDGAFVARFPNGQSPFSGPYQNGDLTHVLHLTPNAVRQLAGAAGLTVVGAHNLRPKTKGLSGVKRALAYALRDLVETVIGYAYFGYRMPFDPNIVVVLRPSEPPPP